MLKPGFLAGLNDIKPLCRLSWYFRSSLLWHYPTIFHSLRNTRERLTGAMPALATGTSYEPGKDICVTCSHPSYCPMSHCFVFFISWLGLGFNIGISLSLKLCTQLCFTNVLINHYCKVISPPVYLWSLSQSRTDASVLSHSLTWLFISAFIHVSADEKMCPPFLSLFG